MARYERVIAGLTVAGQATRKDIERVESSLDLRFPEDLAQFYESSDGAEGWVANSYLAMWPVGQLVELNNAARVGDFCPGLVIVATNGGGDGYGLDRRNGTLACTITFEWWLGGMSALRTPATRSRRIAQPQAEPDDIPGHSHAAIS